MYNSFPELSSKYRMDVSRVLSLLNSDVFDITLTLYISVSMCRIAHLVPNFVFRSARIFINTCTMVVILGGTWYLVSHRSVN